MQLLTVVDNCDDLKVAQVASITSQKNTSHFSINFELTINICA